MNFNFFTPGFIILILFSSELSEEIQKVLSTENRHLPQNLVIFSFKDGGYVPVPRTTNVVTIFEYEGTAIHVDSAEARAQIARDGGENNSSLMPFDHF